MKRKHTAQKTKILLWITLWAFLFGLPLAAQDAASGGGDTPADETPAAVESENQDETTANDESLTEDEFVTRDEYDDLLQKIASMEAAIQQKPNQTPVEVSASVSMGWYADLNNLATGFSNEGTSSVKIIVLPESSREGLARGDVVGYISIEDFQIEMTTTDILGSTGALTAGIKGDKWDTQIWTVPQLTLSKARPFSNDDNDDDDDDAATNLERSGGFAFTYNFRPVDITANFASGVPVEANVVNRYVAWSDIDLKFLNNVPDVSNFRAMPGNRDVFVVRLSAAYEANLGNPPGIGPEYPFKSRDFGAAIEPILILADVGFGLVASVGADGVYEYIPPQTDTTTGTVTPEQYLDPEFDLRADLRLNLSPSVLMDNEDKRTFLAAAAYYNIMGTDLDIEFSGEELEGPDGAIETISGDAVVGFYDLMDDNYWGIDGQLEYQFGDLTPFVGAEYYSDDDLLNFDGGIKFEVIPRVTFTAGYESPSFNLLGQSGGDSGMIRFLTEISY